jgi:hypothetical protein
MSVLIRTAVAVIIVAAGGIILLELLVYRHETIARAYETYGEAVEAGEVRRGWLPSPVPPSARGIEILSNIDTNAAWVRFNADLNDLRAMAAAMSPVPRADAIGVATKPPRRIGLWPSELKGRGGGVADERLDYFVVDGHGLWNWCAGLDWTASSAYAWTCRLKKH